MAEPVLRISDISFSYSARKIFGGLSLEIGCGELCCVLGENGSGKTTLARIAAGLLRVESGGVSVRGRSLSGLSAPERARMVVYSPQKPVLAEGRTALESVVQGLHPYAHSFFDTREELQKARDALTATGCSGFSDREPNSLSGGEYQRVALARAFVRNAPLVVLDEPVAHLDVSHGVSVFRMLRAHLSDESAALVTVHDANLACSFADSVLLLKDGRPLAFGPPREVLDEKVMSKAFGLEFISVEGREGRRLFLPDISG